MRSEQWDPAHAGTAYMIAVNESLGYEVMKSGYRYYEIGVPSVVKA
jgi:hypothetical protein